MKNIFLIYACLCVTFIHSYAQYNTNQNKVWTFGKNAGLDFNSGAPVPIVSGLNPSFPTEGGATVCDADGNLLFYTDGRSVYNRKHLLMPTGNSIVPYATYSTTQAALIVPVISNSQQYYVFSLEHVGTMDPLACRLSYSLVDMSLDTGYGDVVASLMGTIIADSLSEKMIAIGGTNNNIWVVTHLKDTARFLSFEVTSAGINTTPVMSATGSLTGVNCYGYGVLKASPDGRKIVSQSCNSSTVLMRGTELYNFDAATGVVSGCMVLTTSKNQYGAEFSPDNTKLYTVEAPNYDTAEINQYNITAGSAAAIIATKTQVVLRTYYGVTDLRLAPNGKIYSRGAGSTTSYYSEYLDCINTPNMAGSACGYTPNAVSLIGGTQMQLGFPNIYVAPAINTSAPTGITSQSSGISLFPNPANETLFISSDVEIKRINICDLTGRAVHNETFSSKSISIDISKLPAGIYLANINGVITRSFVKR